MRKDINVNYSCNWGLKPILISCDIFFIFVKTSQIASKLVQNCKKKFDQLFISLHKIEHWKLQEWHIFLTNFSLAIPGWWIPVWTTVIWTIVRLNYCSFELLVVRLNYCSIKTTDMISCSLNQHDTIAHLNYIFLTYSSF